MLLLQTNNFLIPSRLKEEKLRELRFELIKANVTANKAGAQTKGIKRAIARLLTFSTADKEVLKTKK